MPTALAVQVMRMPGTEDLPLPSYQTTGSAGMDLYAAIDSVISIPSGERAAVSTGICIALPPDCEAQVRGRSGLARNHGISLANGIGTVDSDYRGQIQVLLINHGPDTFDIRRGDRIAQLVIAPVFRVAWTEVSSLERTLRGEGGFGHTGHTSFVVPVEREMPAAGILRD